MASRFPSAFAPALAAPALVGACAPVAPGPFAAPQASKSAETTSTVPRDCADSNAWRRELGSVAPSAIVGLKPKHIVDTCSGTAQTSGTILILRRTGGADPWTEMLRCPSARVYFGRVDGSWIPEGWVDLEVRPEANGASVTISAESVAKNIELLRRATAFAEGR